MQNQATAPKINALGRQRLSTSAKYFQLIEQRFSFLEEITADNLAQRIDSKTHRRYLLACRFVVESLGLRNFSQARAVAAEWARIDEILSTSEPQPFYSLLETFVAQLTKAQIQPRTIRLYLSAAATFCADANARSDAPWASDAVTTHLQSYPGQRANLFRFVSHCRLQYGWDVFIPHQATALPLAAQMQDLKETLCQMQGRPINTLSRREVSNILAKATGLPVSALKTTQRETFNPAAPKAIRLADDTVIEPGHLLYPYALRWMAIRQGQPL